MTRASLPGRGWAYTGATLGGVVSIAANVAHSFIPPHGALAGWRPEPGAVVGAIVWPVFLFVAVEILARVQWPNGWAWQLLRFGGLLPVAVVAGFVSYRHLSGLLAHYGEEPIVYYLGPLAVDGLMVMATGALLATARHRTIPAAGPTTATDPAAPTGGPTLPDPAPSTVDTRPIVTAVVSGSAVPTPAQVAARITPPAPSSPSAPPSERRPAVAASRPRPRTPAATAARLAPSAPDTSVTAPKAAQLSLPVASPELLVRVADEAAAYQAEHGTAITPGQLAVRLRMSSEQAAQALASLDRDSGTRPINGTPVRAIR